MAVFYPAARHWTEDDEFPEDVQLHNPGINTVGDYMRIHRAKTAGAAEAIG